MQHLKHVFVRRDTSPLPVNSHIIARSAEDALIICSKRAQKDAINAEYLRELPGEPVVYEAKDIDLPLNMFQKNLLHSNRDAMPTKLFLKVGAKVVLTRNLDVKNKLVNGTLATVTALQSNYITLTRLLPTTSCELSQDIFLPRVN